MSTEDLLHLDPCGCCQAQVLPTPEEITNRPGLPAIRYRIGRYSSFRQAMIEGISSKKVEADGKAFLPLRGWTTRASDDYGIALLEMWSYLADILTFYQERIANETFLRTAVLPESVQRLAALLGYEPAPGVAATAHLAFTLEKGKQVQIPVGLRVQSVPGQNEKSQKFEAVETVAADFQLNQIRTFPKLELHNPLFAGSAGGFLKPESASTVTEELSSGDRFIVFFRGMDATTEDKEVMGLAAQLEHPMLDWEPEIQSGDRNVDNSQAFRFNRKFRLFGFNAPTKYLHTSTDAAGNVKVKEFEEGDLTSEVDYTFDLQVPGNKLYLDSVYDDLKKGTRVLIPVRAQSSGTAPNSSTRLMPLYRLYSPSAQDHLYTASAVERDQVIASPLGYQDEGIVGYIFSSKEPGTTELYRFLLTTGDHFYTTDNAEKNSMVVDKDQGIAGYVFSSPEPGTTPLYRLFNSQVGDHFYTTNAIERDRAQALSNYSFPDPPWRHRHAGIACFIYASKAVLTTVTGSRQVARQKGLLNATVTEITVEDPIPPIENLREIEVYELANPEIPFWTHHYPDAISGETVYVPLSRLTSLEPGRTILLDDKEARPQTVTVTSASAADTDADGQHDHLAITYTPALTRDLDRETAVLYGNVALATHGETVAREVLGDGDASAAFQSFPIRKSPVTFVPRPGASHSVANTLQIRADGVLWDRVDTLYGHGGEERIYTARVNDAGVMVVRFGDGKTGARLPSGHDNIVASYRQGLGRDGMVRANSLTTLLDRPVGLKSVRNPAKADNGDNPETMQEARAKAPNTVRTFGRIVSLRDFEDAARESVGVAKARASWTWDGEEQVVYLTVAGNEGAKIVGEPRKNLVNDLNSRRDPNRKLEVVAHCGIPVQVVASIKVHPAYVPEEVQVAAQKVLENYFAFDNLEFGQSINLSDIYRTLQDVTGVVAVDIDFLQFKKCEDRDSHGATTRPVQGRLRIAPTELAFIQDSATDAIVNIREGQP